MSDLRNWIRTADDHAYSEHIQRATEESPRTEVVDLYGPIAKWRAEHPVQPMGQSALVGREDFRTMSTFSERPLYSLLGYDEVRAAFGDGDTFSSSIHNETIGMVWGETLLGMDGAKHARYRKIIAKSFRRALLDDWETSIIEPVVNGLIDRMTPKLSARETVGLVSEYTVLFPVYITAELLGLPREDVAKFTGWAADTITIFHDPVLAMSASKALHDYLQGVVDDRRANPTKDLIGQLIAAESDGQYLTDDEIINFLRILLPAGAETTYRSTSNLLFGLLANPDQLDALKADTTLIDAAMEEALRWEPPLTSVNRLTTREVNVSGVTIPRDAIVACNMGAANRDPKRWSNPDAFDIHREPLSHIAFAYGPHLCVGMHLAKREMSVAVLTLLERFPELGLDPHSPRPQIHGIGFRAPLDLPVVARS
ncbi:MAG: cytochrome P450 [Mycobacterium sp.]